MFGLKALLEFTGRIPGGFQILEKLLPLLGFLDQRRERVISDVKTKSAIALKLRFSKPLVRCRLMREFRIL